MILVKFLFIGTIMSVVLGELGRFPFGGSSTSITLTDGFLLLTLIIFLIWKINTNERILIPPSFKWLFYFWGIAAISLILSLIVLPISEVIKGSLYLFRFILYSSTAIVVFNLIQQKIIIQENLIKLLTTVGAVIGLLGFIQLLSYPNFEDPPFYLTDFGFDPHRGRLTSTFLDPNFLGVFLVINLGLAIYLLIKYPCLRSWGSMLLLLGGVILTMSRSAYLSLFILAVLFVSLGKKFINFKWMGLITAITLIILISVPQYQSRLKGAFLIDESASLRFESWWKGTEIIKESPVFGVGFNNIRAATLKLNLVQTYSTEGGHSGAGVDSSLLFVLATTGILGLIIYLIFWGKAIRNLWVKNSLFSIILIAILISVISSSQFINSLFFPPIMLWYFTLLGLEYNTSG